MPDHDRARRRRLGRDALQSAQSADAVACEPADLLADVGVLGRDGVVVIRLDAHDARLLRRAKPDREHGPEHDRHLAEDVPGAALADDAPDPIDELDRLDATLEHGEERALRALVRRVLARHEGDIRGRAGKPLAIRRAESGEDRDGTNVVGCHHDPNPHPPVVDAALRPIACKAETAAAQSRSPQDRTGRRYSHTSPHASVLYRMLRAPRGEGPATRRRLDRAAPRRRSRSQAGDPD